MLVSNVCDAIIAHQGARSMDSCANWEDDQDLKDSKYAKDLVQVAPEKKISPHPKDWVCEKSGDTQNLWLNLSDGFIGGGRKFWDGSGGSNGAVEHFNDEHSKGNFYPLAVKLGTITPQGADVYSYAPDEDRMVKDPYLAQHLQHWGIDVMRMEKTDKTLAEMEVDLNQNYDWSRICESGDKPLERLRGPGLVGLKNLGNSCYMNSTVQLLMSLPETKARYFDPDMKIRQQAPSDAPTYLVTQIAKLVTGLLGDRYAPSWKDGDDEDDPKLLVAPQMFRALIGKKHQEFSSGRQQDAGEFLQYFLEQIARGERTTLGSRLDAGRPFASLFEFAIEERFQENDGQKRVKYTRNKQNMFGLVTKLEDAENLAEVTAWKASQSELGEKDAKKPKRDGDIEELKPLILLPVILERFAAADDSIAFRGATATKTCRLATMPRYLLVQIQRYYLDEKWCPNKLDCKVPMPDTLNLEYLRGKGLQPSETAMPEDDSGGSAAGGAPQTVEPAGQPDDLIVAQLLSMGLQENAAKRASLAVQNSGADVAAAWYFEHSEDPDINDPLPQGGEAGGGGTTDQADPEMVATLACMGFAEVHVVAALKNCGNNAERAADWLFSHSDNLDGAVTALSAGGGGEREEGGTSTDYDDGKGEYSLVGFVSHMGRHTSHGHYVCHMKRGKDNGWVIFDDQKVARSEAPPLDLGYVYLYRRQDAA